MSPQLANTMTAEATLSERLLAAIPIAVLLLRREDELTLGGDEQASQLLGIELAALDDPAPLARALPPEISIRQGLTTAPLSHWLRRQMRDDRVQRRARRVQLNLRANRSFDAEAWSAWVDDREALAVFLRPLSRPAEVAVERRSSDEAPLERSFYDRICFAARNGLQATGAAVLHFDEAAGELALVSIDAPDDDIRSDAREPIDGDTLAARCVREQRSLSIDELDAPLGCAFQENSGSAIAVPMGGAQRLSALICYHQEPKRFGDSAVKFLQTLAGLVTEALRFRAAESAVESGKRELDRVLATQQVQRAARLSSLGTLAAGIAHEIKNPINSIQMNVELVKLLLAREGSEEKIQECLDRVRSDCGRCAEISNGIMNFARSDDEDSREAVTVKQLHSGVQRLLGSELRGSDTRVTWRCDDETASIFVNRVALEQAIANLVRNAAEADADQVEVHVEFGEGEAQIAISDNGHGIAAVDLPRALDPFFTTRGGGRHPGLGLTLADQVADAHAGTLKLDSGDHVSEPWSTTVSLQLPAEAT